MPLWLSPQESHTSRLEQKAKEKAHKTAMDEQMRAVTEARAAQEAAKMQREAEVRERQRSAIATPGMHRPASTPRRKFGL